MIFRFLFLISLFFVTKSSFAQQTQSEILYSELVIYRSKIDKTDAYLRKLEMIETAWIEKWDKSLLEERIGSIDAGPNQGFSEALGLASMLPGWYGKAAKGVKIYDYGSRTIKEATQHTPSIANFEEQVRETIGRLMTFVAKDPALSKTVNKYLAKEFGDIKAKPSDIINFYPPFADHITLDQLKQMLKKQSAESEEVKRLLNDLQAQYAKLEEVANSERQYDQKINEINEWYTYGTLISRLVGLKNPKLGRQIGLAVNAYQRGASIAAAGAAGKMSNSLMTANYVMLALDIVMALSNTPTPEEEILKGLGQLHKLIVAQTEKILEAINGLEVKVDEINRKIDLLYNEIIENRALVVTLHQKVNNIRDEHFNDKTVLLNAVRAGFNRDLKNIIAESIGKKEVFLPGTYTITADLFNTTFQRLHSYATDHLSDQLSNPTYSTIQTPEKLADELGAVPQLANLSFISSFLEKQGIGTTNNVEMDASMWILSAAALTELVTDWPEYQRNINPEIIKQVYLKGFGIEKFAQSSSFSNNPTLYRNLLIKIRDNYTAYMRILQSEILGALSKEHNTAHLLTDVKFDPGSIDTLTSLELIDNFFGNSSIRTIPMSANFVAGTWGKKNLKVPAFVNEQFIPKHIESAYQIGAIDLRAHFTMDHGKHAKYNDTLVLYAYLKEQDTLIRIFERSHFQKKSTGPQITSVGYSAGNETPQESANYIIQHWLVKNGKSVDYSGNLKLIDSLTKSTRRAYMNNLISNSIENLETTTGFLDLSRTLDGYHDLLIHLVSIGHSETFVKSDTLENYLFNANYRQNYNIKKSGISDITFSDYKKRILDWNEQLTHFMATDKKTQKLPYNEISALLHELDVLYNNMTKGVVTRSPFARERHISALKNH